MSIPIETLQNDVFGQIAQQIVEGRGGYDQDVAERVYKRIFEVGEVVGRTATIRVRPDGVGNSEIVTVYHHTIRDPIAFGV